MTISIFLAAWTIAAVLVGLAAGRFIRAGKPTDDGDDWEAVQNQAWQARRAEWARRMDAEDRIKSWQRDE